MAIIQTDEHFRQAVNQWRATATFQGTPFINALERKIYDEIPDPTPELPGRVRYVDVTPVQAVLEAALDTALAQQTQEAARALIRENAATGFKGAAGTVILQNITDDSADIVTDLSTVANLSPATFALFLPQWKLLTARILAREARILNRLELLVKLASHE